MRIHRVLVITILCLAVTTIWTMFDVRKLYSRSQETPNSIALNNHPIATWAQQSPEASSYDLDLDIMSQRVNTADFFVTIGGSRCFRQGLKMLNTSESECFCRQEYAGIDCGVPTSVWSIPKNQHNYTLRQKPRRIIMAMVVNHELDMTEIRCKMLHDVVDIFVISESNITTAGDKKELIFYKAFKEGFLRELQHKILYIFQDHLPSGFAEDGWLADSYLRTYMSQTALSRIKGMRDDDIFLSFDADEIPKRQVIQFLRLFDGFNDPYWFSMRHSIYGYFWQVLHLGKPAIYSDYVGSTVGFLKNKCHGNVILLRRRRWQECQDIGDLHRSQFEVGIEGNYAAYHCSWCFRAEGILSKLVAANLADGPRFGRMPEKRNLTYIQSLIENGKWFDNSTNEMIPWSEENGEYAPEYVLQNREKYKYLLLHPNKTS